MGLFDKFKKKKKVFQQDTNQMDEHPGMIFIVHLLMDKLCEMPEKEHMHAIMSKHFGEVDCFCHDGKVAGFAPKKYLVHFEKDNVDVPPQLMITDCMKIEKPVMDDISRSQLWNCPNGSEILDECKYQVIATDMLAAGLYYKDRAEMLVDYIEALVEMYPTCKAVVFETSKKMFTREDIVNCTMPKESRFIHYAVNVRYFNVQGTSDMVIDSLGMSTLFLPDLQYHFHGMDPNEVVNHAYNVLSYIYDNDNPIKDGDHIDGIVAGRMSQDAQWNVVYGKMSQDVQWNVQYENSLIQPIREVIDINMGEYAAGNR